MANSFNTSTLTPAGKIAEMFRIHSTWMDIADYTLCKDAFNSSEYNSGMYVSIPLVNQRNTQTGYSITPAPVQEATTPVTVRDLVNDCWSLNLYDRIYKLKDEQEMERLVKPSAMALAKTVYNQIANDSLVNAYMYVGTVGTPLTIDTLYTLDAMAQSMNLNLEREIVMNYVAAASIAKALRSNDFTPEHNDYSVSKAYFGTVLDGMNLYKESYMPSFNNTLTPPTTGTIAADVADGSNTLTIQGCDVSNGTIKAGTLGSIVGVYWVDPVTKVVLPYNFTFVVSADAPVSGTGTATLSINPYSPVNYLSTNQRQNINTQIVTNMTVNFVNQYNYALACCSPFSLMLSFPKLTRMDLMTNDIFTDPGTNLELAVYKQGQILNIQNITRVSVGYANGWAPQTLIKLIY